MTRPLATAFALVVCVWLCVGAHLGAQAIQTPQEQQWGVPGLPDKTDAPAVPAVNAANAAGCEAYTKFIEGLQERLKADAATKAKLNGLRMGSAAEGRLRTNYLARLDEIDANLTARIAEAEAARTACRNKFAPAPPKGGPPAGGPQPDPKALCKECIPLLDADIRLIKAFAAYDDKITVVKAEIAKLQAKKNRTADEAKTLKADLAMRKVLETEYKALRDRSNQIGASREICKKVFCEKPAVCPECAEEGKKVSDAAADLMRVWEKLITLIDKEIAASADVVAGKDEMALEDVRDDIDVQINVEKRAKTDYDKALGKLDACTKEKCPPKEKEPGDGHGYFKTVPESGQLYVVFNAGFGFGSSKWTETPASNSTDNFKVSGFVAGGGAGRQILGGKTPVALEGDFAITGLSGDTQSNCFNPCETSNRWLATARARVGIATGGPGSTSSMTPYVTGGVAFGNIRARVGTFSGGSATRLGWTIGGGVEFPFMAGSAHPMSAHVEFRRIDLGQATICTPANCGGQAAISLSTNVVTFGVNMALRR